MLAWDIYKGQCVASLPRDTTGSRPGKHHPQVPMCEPLRGMCELLRGMCEPPTVSDLNHPLRFEPPTTL